MSRGLFFKSLISFFARHPTAPNLILVLMIACGIVASTSINRQFFPDFGLDYITISIAWPGASANDVDATIVQAVEPAVRFLNGVKNVSSVSYEGLASTTIEFFADHDMQLALSEVESAVSQLQTLPSESERPVIRKVHRYETVSKLVIWGDATEREIKRNAKSIRDRFLALGVENVTLRGLRKDQVLVEITPGSIYKYKLSIDEIADRLRMLSIDMPAGEISGGQKQIRSVGQKNRAKDFEELEVKSLPGGQKLLLKNLAQVSESVEDDAVQYFRNGFPAIEIDIQRSSKTDALKISNLVKKELINLRSMIPNNINLEEYDVKAESIKERINLLIFNGISGLFLVLIVLFLFMRFRVAIWIAVGIPASLLATLAMMQISDQTVNMVSLFGMIMAIGIVVDDAIVVGEHADYHSNNGLEPMDAAILGASSMAVPVVSSTLTTIAAFIPLFIISGIMGQIISAIPFVVVTVLIASLIECFLVLPFHLGNSFKKPEYKSVLTNVTNNNNRRFQQFKNNKFRFWVKTSVANRYSTVAISISLFILSLSLILGGRVGYQFFPSPEPNMIYSNLKMLPGSSREETKSVVLRLEKSLLDAVATMGYQPDVLKMSLGIVGANIGNNKQGSNSTDVLGGVVVELISSDKRKFKSDELINEWRNQTGSLEGVDNLTFVGQRSGPPGGDLDIRIAGASEIETRELKNIAIQVTDLIKRYPGISNVDDDLPFGKPEILVSVSERGLSMGYSTSIVASQIRSHIDGVVATRFARSDEEVNVKVKLKPQNIENDFLQNIYLKSPDGAISTLKTVVDLKQESGFLKIKRENAIKEVSITADIDESVTRLEYIRDALIEDGLSEIVNSKNLKLRYDGRAREQKETSNDMSKGAILGLILIYIILAWVFSSYTRPLVVISIIPFGLIGTVFGHLVLGFDLTILSFFAILGLSGILINDSIVLVRRIDERAEHESLEDAVVNGSCDRLRAVLLTSATTIGGLTPLLFEKSLQAQFLIPMAITMVFGIAFATFIILFLIPSVILTLEDLKKGILRT